MMRAVMRWLVLAAAGLISAGSINMQGTVGGTAYTARQYTAPPGVTDDDLYAATVRIFNDLGWEIREKDRDAGIVSTIFMVAGSTSMANKQLESWRVRIAEGTLRIELDCKVALISGGDFRGLAPCDSDKRESAASEPDVRTKIFADAEIRAKKRAARAAEPGQP